MSSKPSITPKSAPSRALVLASFGGCGALLIALFVVLLGCGHLLPTPDISTVPPDPPNPNTGKPANDRNAILCHCDCDGIVAPISAPTPIAFAADDASQAIGKSIDTSSNPLVLGQGNTVGLRFPLGVPQGATIKSA